MALAAILWIVRRRSLSYYYSIVHKYSCPSHDKPNAHTAPYRSRFCPKFFKKLFQLVKLVLPQIRDKEVGWTIIMIGSMLFRTCLSIRLADINAGITKAMIKHKFPLFVKRLILLAAHALPASFINSYLEYLMKRAAVGTKTRMTNKFLGLYLQNKALFQTSNLDTRVSNPEHRMTVDIDKWSYLVCSVLFNTVKPCFDIYLFTRELSRLLGWEGPLLVIFWYLISAIVIRFVSPPFGKLVGVERKLEYDYKVRYRTLIEHSDQVILSNMQEGHQAALVKKHETLISHIKSVMSQRLYFGTFDSLLVKYGAVLFGYAILSFPTFGRNSASYLKMTADNPAQIIEDYVRHSSLMINLAKGIGRLVVSYRDLNSLMTHTHSLHEFYEVLEDLNKGIYVRQTKPQEPAHRIVPKRGNFERSTDMIKLQKVPVVTPNGERLYQPISFEIHRGEHCYITGVDLFGRKAFTRAFFELWPMYGGTITRPEGSDILYIPEKTIFPEGTLRDILIKPGDTSITHVQLQKWFKAFGIESMLSHLNAYKDWNVAASASKRQKLALVRLLSHKPIFALLDNSMSYLSSGVVAKVYQLCKEREITLMTMAGEDDDVREYHSHLLRLTGKGGEWRFSPIEHDDEQTAEVTQGA